MSTLSKQYKAIKRKYPDAILLFRVGEFYETFGEDAKVTSQKIGIALTQSTEGDLQETAAFPFHALDGYLRSLVKAGYRVAICEALGDPKRAKTTTKKA